MHHRFQRKKCPEDLSEVPPFMPLAQFKLRPEKQILAMFTDIARDDGYAYAEDLLATVHQSRLIIFNSLLCVLYVCVNQATTRI